MISLLLLFFSLSSFSVFGALYKKRFEEIMPITVVGIMLFLYLFYIFNMLNVGFISLIVLMLITYLLFIFKFIKKDKSAKKEIIKCIFTPGFAIYLLGFVGLFVLTYGNNVLLWDELRLWGAYPKILFYDGSLQLGDKAYLLSNMRSYNPGMPLFLYFVTKVMGTFKEHLLFFAYTLVGYSILLPVTKNIKWKDWFKIPFYLLGLFIVPLLFANSNNDSLVYYYTLFIEPALGIIFGYSMYLTFSSVINDKFKYILFLVMLSGMTLFKDTGILFSVTAGLACIFGELFNYKNYKKTKYGWIKLVLIILLPLLIFGSWKGIQSLYKSENMYTSVLDKNEIISLFTNPTSSQQKLLDDAQKEILFTPIVRSNFSSLDRLYTFPILFVCLIGFLVAYMILCGKKDFKKNGIPILCFGIGSIVFFLGTLFVYFFSIHAVASFPRYISLIFTAGSVLLSLLLVEKFSSKIKNEKHFKYFIGTLLVFSIMALPIRQPMLAVKDSLSKINLVVSEYADVISSNTSVNDDILLVFGEEQRNNLDYVIYHHQIYLELLDEGYYSLDQSFVGDSNSKIGNLDDYDYVYFIITEECDEEDFEITTGYDMKYSSLFKVVKSNDNINLTKVN